MGAGFLVGGGPEFKQERGVIQASRISKLKKKSIRLSHLLTTFCFFLPASSGWADEDLEALEVWDLVYFLVEVAIGPSIASRG
ncbi:hypothetical protein COP2_028318 [Malus domestica]